MALVDLADWIEEFSHPKYTWYVKRLSANDTLASGSHQAGIYIPKPVFFRIFPNLNQPHLENPDTFFDLRLDSHGDSLSVRAIWYNNKLRGGTRDETRLTRFGGSRSALRDPENTGALAIFVFIIDEPSSTKEAHVWVCERETEEELIEEKIGPVEPGSWTLWNNQDNTTQTLIDDENSSPCSLAINEIPPAWLQKFPTGLEIFKKTIELCSGSHLNPDSRLIKRRDCEYAIFRSVEKAIELDGIKKGFAEVEDFLERAQTILQRRKSRGGRSLELHVRQIFLEEGLREKIDFSYQVESEPGQKPDFIFPSHVNYLDLSYPEEKLRMLAVKTTCKDRWRQILQEAKRVPRKHLLTLQQGVSVGQFREMNESNVQLVVPAPLKKHYPESVQPHLQTLESFIGDIRLLSY